MTIDQHDSENVAAATAATTAADIVATMTLAEKVGQMTQVELGSITADEVATWSIGSVFSGGGGNPGDGSAEAWRGAVDSFVAGSRGSRIGIPILYATDAVHGHNNVLGATIFPHNIAMGATGDAALMYSVARAAALETAATGARWSFAPCLAVPQDLRWGRTYEGFSQDTGMVSALGAAAVRGWHGDDLPATGVLACAKHFVGEGATLWGTAGKHRHTWIDWWDAWGPEWRIDQGDIQIDENELRRVHLPPFVAAIDAGALTVMACYGSWHGRRLHAHRYLLTEVLKDELRFTGFVVSDWMAIEQIDADYASAVEHAICSGIDMVMVPFDYQRFIETVVELVDQGRISVERLDDAVGRILRVKARLGLLDDTPGEPVSLDVVGCDEHRELARAAASASVVVLTNASALPIPNDATVLAAGEALDDIGIACGGWTISWEGSVGPVTEGRTILDGLRHGDVDRIQYERDGRFVGTRADFGVVTVHELPYVEGGGDRSDLSIPDDQVDVVRRVRDLVDQLVVVVVSGRPLLMDAVLEYADAVVAAWLPGTQADGIADVLLGRTACTGRLSVQWPRHETQISGGAGFSDTLPAWPIGHYAGISPHNTNRR